MLIVGVLALSVILWAIIPPAAWQLSMTGQSETVTMTLSRQTDWTLDAALVCISERKRVDRKPADNDPNCGGGSWQELKMPNAIRDGVQLSLSGKPESPIRATIETRNNGGVEMSLRRVSGKDSIGQLSLHSGDEEPITLPPSVNIIWSPVDRAQDARTVVLPFTGDITVGRDVASGRDKMLASGQLSVFAASDESLAGRALAEDAALVMGDQVRLTGTSDRDGTFAAPKGFVRFKTNSTEQLVTMDVIAFAPAEGVVIQRYGGGEYRFKPGWWVKLKHQSTLVIGFILVTGFLSVLSSLLSVLTAFKDWLGP